MRVTSFEKELYDEVSKFMSGGNLFFLIVKMKVRISGHSVNWFSVVNFIFENFGSVVSLCKQVYLNY